MKRVYFTRHGKSSWDDPLLDDYDRPLKNRGRKDAAIIAHKMQEFDHLPEMIFSSSALRAKETALIFKEYLNIPLIQYFQDLYHAGPANILEFIQQLENDYYTIMLCGHNPGYTELINKYADRYIYNVPTSGTFLIEYSCDNWSTIKKCDARLAGYWFPKMYKS